MQPLEANSLQLFLLATEAGLENGLELELAFALGDEYPKVVRFDLGTSYLMREDGVFFGDAASGLSITAVRPVDGGVEARVIDAGTFEIGIEEEGDFPVLLEGEWNPRTPDEPARAGFSVEVTIRVRRIALVGWNTCAEPRYVVSGAGFDTASISLYDASGYPFQPANATSTRPATVNVHAEPGTSFSTMDGLGTLVVTGPEQSVEVRSHFGSLGTFELVSPGRIDGLAARFYMSASWSRGETELVSGDSVSALFGENYRAHISVAPELTIGGTRICSPHLPEWFELRSATPETCPVVTEPVCTDNCWRGELPTGASVVSNGACDISLHGAAFGGTQGLETGLSVEFVEPSE